MSRLPSHNYEKVIAACVELSSKKEPDQLTATEIIEKAGIARSTFYSMFSSKDEILAHMMRQVKLQPEELMTRMLEASNDFERILCITNAYLELAEQAGPKLCRYILRGQLVGSYDYLTFIRDYEAWLLTLIGNCQKAGIIGNPAAPEDLLELQYDISTATLFTWAEQNGAFSLTEEVRRKFLVLLHVTI